jgi:hypothetical protein
MRITNLFFILFLTSTLASFGQSSSPQIPEGYKLSSELFKSKVGLDRLNEFIKLNELIKTFPILKENAPEYDYLIGDYTTTLKDLVNLLGEPDVKVSNSIYQYNLNVSSSDSKADIGINNEGFVTYSVISLSN